MENETVKPQQESGAPDAQAAEEQLDYKAEYERLKSEQEKLAAKYQRAQEDLQKFRTRKDELEAAQRRAEEEALARKPLEEQVNTYKTQLEQLQREREQIAARLEQQELLSELHGVLLEAGVDPRKLSEASDYYLFTLERLKEDQEPPDIAEWLKRNPQFLASTPSTTTGANLAGNKPKGPATLAEAISQHLRR